MLKFFVTLIAIALTEAGVLAGPGEEFATANRAFIDGDFKGAYSVYQQLLDDGHINADLLYNLGNASYRLGRSGEAVLWYERSLVIDPTHKEARQNLRFLKRSTGILQFDRSEIDLTLAGIRRDTLVRISTFAGWLALLGFAAALSLRLGIGAKTCLWIAAPMLALLAIAAGFGVCLKHRAQENLASRAIVTADETKALTAPARAADPVIQLPLGSQLGQISKRGAWDYVDVPGDLRGWVPDSSITRLWPYDPALAD